MVAGSRVIELEPSFPGRWAVAVTSSDRPEEVIGAGDTGVFSTASIGKLLLLLAVAEGLETSGLSSDALPERTAEDQVADSGLWQHLRINALPIEDLAVLVAAVSDNLATNVLLRHVGLSSVADVTCRLGLQNTALHDRVRDVRETDHPARLSSGSAAELVRLVTAVQCGTALGAGVSRRVRDWLRTGTDLSMVAGATGLDPLAHPSGLWHKTGTDVGVRADVGVIERDGGWTAYAVLVEFDPAVTADSGVLAFMNEVGARLIHG